MKKLLSAAILLCSVNLFAANIFEGNEPTVTSLTNGDRFRVIAGTHSGNIAYSNLWSFLGTNGVATTPTEFVMIGDSLTDPISSQGNIGQDWPSRLFAKSNFFFRAANSANLAVGATTLSQWVSTYYTQYVTGNILPPVTIRGTTNAWLFMWLGINDVVNSGTFAQMTNDWLQLAGRSRTNRFYVGAFTVPTNANGTMSAAEDQVRTNFNVWLRTNSVLYDWLIDADTLITNATPGTGQTAAADGIHWKAVEYERLSTYMNTNYPMAKTPGQAFWAALAPSRFIDAQNVTMRDASYAEGGFRVSGGFNSGTFFSGPSAAEFIVPTNKDAFYIQVYGRDSNSWRHGNFIAEEVNLYGVNKGVVIQNSSGLPQTNSGTGFWVEPSAVFNNTLGVTGTGTFSNSLVTLGLCHIGLGMRVTNSGIWPNGESMELGYTFGTGGLIQSYDRSGSNWRDTQIQSKDVIMYPIRDFRIDNHGAATEYTLICTNANGAVQFRLPYSLQEVRQVSNALQTVTIAVTFNDTALNVANTTNVLSCSITPKRSDTVLVVEGVLNFGGTAPSLAAAGIFRDASATAGSVHLATIPAASQVGQISFYSKFPSTSTSATTFNIRLGSSTGTLYMNGLAAARLFGGTTESWIVVREEAQ